jgi:hypothetical protein
MRLLNFNYPLTPAQLTEIEQLAGTAPVQVDDIPTHLDPQQPFAPQVRALLDSLALTPQQWQTLPLLINPPGHSLVATVLLAQLHNRMGHFPTVIRLRPDHATTPPRYTVAEIINLQAVRDEGRVTRQIPEAATPVTDTSVLPALVPSDFSLACFEFVIEAFQDLQLPRFKGSALRGGFGQTFKDVTCTWPTGCAGQRTCRMKNDCPYGYIFETSPPDDSPVLKKLSDIPRPFIIRAPSDTRTMIPAGDRLSFGVTLVGEALKYLPHFVLTFNELGQHVGLGATRAQYRLLSVDWVQPFTGEMDVVFRAGDELLRAPEARLTAAHLNEAAALLPNRQITLEFVTPARLISQKKPVRDAPPFDVLIRTLLSRVSALSLFHCGQALELDFRAVLDEAARVKVDRADVRWVDKERFSNRQRRKIHAGGLMGRVTYRGDLVPFLPLLVLGELVHLGKGAVFGNGQYLILRGDREN